MKRTTSCSRRIQHILPRDDREAVNSAYVRFILSILRTQLTVKDASVL